MVRLGKVHDNLMVDVVATNNKLRKRARRLVMQLASVDEAGASDLLQAAGGSVKIAVVMARNSVNAQSARELLQAHGGSLRESLR
jgi:N-acetylmuramic acid 6-phosphate etherase